jgi:hypothetical protein
MQSNVLFLRDFLQITLLVLLAKGLFCLGRRKTIIATCVSLILMSALVLTFQLGRSQLVLSSHNTPIVLERRNQEHSKRNLTKEAEPGQPLESSSITFPDLNKILASSMSQVYYKCNNYWRGKLNNSRLYRHCK